MLTLKEFDRTANTVFRSVEELFHPFDIEPEIERQDFNIDRVYRLFIRDTVRSPSVQVPVSVYRDAVIHEVHNVSGMERQRRLYVPPTEVASVRLIHVGNEDVLVKVMLWWSLLTSTHKQAYSTLVAEQNAYVAQEQVRKAGLTPRFVYNMQQLVELDLPVKQEVSGGNKTWFMI